MPSPPAGDDPETLRDHAACLLALQDEVQERLRLAHELDRTHHSLSWRVTAPLRRLRAWLRPVVPAAPTLAPGQAGDAAALADPVDLLRARLSQPPLQVASGRPRLYVDVTELAREDLVGGIHRVTRRILGEWLLQPPAGLRVEPVRLAAGGRYVHARAHLARMLGLAPGEAGADVPIAPTAADRFIGLDLVRDHPHALATAIAPLREAGARVGFVLYDLLPLQHPEWFPEGTSACFGQWLEVVARGADRVLCISQTVAGEAAAALAAAAPTGAPRTAHFPLGDDLQVLAPARLRLPPRRPGATRWLMVGTIEPRKGHAQALEAFEQLWAQGAPVELAIAGRPGWRVASLLARLAAHPERGRRLHWLDAADDADLLAAYRDSDVLLAASLGEGYGLPVVEAAREGLPILARDLPVFREVAGDGADYFHADDGASLAAAVQAWMQRHARDDVADPARVARHGWRESAAALARELLAD